MKYIAALLSVFLSGSMHGWAGDTLQCSNNQFRSWWDVLHIDLTLNLQPDIDSIQGICELRAKVLKPENHILQIDLQEPLTIQDVQCNDINVASYIKKEGHYLITLPQQLRKNQTFTLKITYSGIPQIAKNAPWDGGFIRKKDESGKPWIAVACQGVGASIWYPCKDLAMDEPDEGADLHYITDASLTAIGNGRLIDTQILNKDLKEWHWRVTQPINLYDITFYIGDYVHWNDTFNGKKGILDIDYYVLRSNKKKALTQFAQVKSMLNCFEYWLGAYPFYEDGYKLVEAPYLGMEHQSAVAYGNGYQNGYLGKDRSKTGVGLLFDFIIAHESGHEWFGNSISTNDAAYTWIHEGFTTYTETLMAECTFGKEKAFAYQRGEWSTIKNDKPVEGLIESCDEGSGDHYSKAAAMVHMIRIMIDDDEQFRMLLNGLSEKFYHQTVSGTTIENYIIQKTGLPLEGFFNQYLRSPKMPQLHLKKKNTESYSYSWTHCNSDFKMPVQVWVDHKKQWLYPTTAPQLLKGKDIQVSKDFYIEVAID